MYIRTRICIYVIYGMPKYTKLLGKKRHTAPHIECILFTMETYAYVVGSSSPAV